MAFRSLLAHSPLFLLAAAHAKSQIAWTPCELDGATVPVSCGTLSVPLDYTDSHSNATLALELRRIPAAHSPSRGSILFNFGGPGDTGFVDVAVFGDLLRVLTGGYHDLVVFAPRGTGNTLPFSCYASPIERSVARLGIVAGGSSDVALGKLWAVTQVAADACYAARNETGALVGTAFVARDMMRIVDALGEDGLLRYWGYSYGTLLGATVAAMFPDRMDKLILDGVVNPREYYQNKEVQMFTDTDAVFAGFVSGCIASANCPLRHNHTSASLQAAITAFFHTLKYNPVVITLPPPTGSFMIEYTLVKQLLLLNLYSPASWPSFAGLLDGLMTANTSAIAAYIDRLLSSSSDSAPTADAGEALTGIKCSDVRPAGRATSLEGIRPVVEGRHRMSSVVGDAADYLPIECAQWRMPAREQYAGGFEGVRTRGRVLVIGNAFDPVTPLVAARNLSKGFERSVLLKHLGYGHSSLAQGSLCTAMATRAYFVNGTLPEPGTECHVDVDRFAGNDGWDEVMSYFKTGNATATAATTRSVAHRIARRWEAGRHLVGMGPLESLIRAV